MSPRAATAIVLCVGLFLGACTSAAGSEPADERTTTSIDATVKILDDPTTAPTSTVDTTTATPALVGRNVVIRERPDGLGEQEATIFEPELPTTSTAIVVLLHGAGSGAGRDWYTLLAQTITELGIVVVNADWLASPSHAAESAADAVCAVAFAQEIGHSNGVSQPRVIVVGHSGGGQVGMLAALDPEAFEEWCDTAAQASVWAYVGLAGDPAAAAEGGNLYSLFKDDPETRSLMDGYTHLGGNPDLIARFIHGAKDGVVPLERSKAFHEAMVENGYDSAFIEVADARHWDPAIVSHPAGIAALDAIRQLIEMSAN